MKKATGLEMYLRSDFVMTFGLRVRELRHARGWSLRDLAAEVYVGFKYLSRFKNERPNFGDYPSVALIHQLANARDADEEELLVLAKRVSEPVRKRFFQRPNAFRAFAKCDDATLDKLMKALGQKKKAGKQK